MGEPNKEKIIYQTKDLEYYFYNVNQSEIVDELKQVNAYKGNESICLKKLKDESSLFLSIRNKQNMPFVIIEIDNESSQVINVVQKNSQPINQFFNSILMEFIFYINDF